MTTKEKLLTYHSALACALRVLAKRRLLERNYPKIGRISAELMRTGRKLGEFPETGDFPDSEQPDVFHQHHHE